MTADPGRDRLTRRRVRPRDGDERQIIRTRGRPDRVVEQVLEPEGVDAARPGASRRPTSSAAILFRRAEPAAAPP